MLQAGHCFCKPYSLEAGGECFSCSIRIERDAKVAQLGHLHANKAAGVDAAKGFEIHVHIQRDAVVGAAAAHPQAERGDFFAVHVNAGGVGARLGANTLFLQVADDACFDEADQRTDADAGAADVEQQVHHCLTRAVVGDLAAAVYLDDGDVARREQVFGFARLSLGVNGRVLYQPDLVFTRRIARGGVGAHGIPDFLIRTQAEVFNMHQKSSLMLCHMRLKKPASSTGSAATAGRVA